MNTYLNPPPQRRSAIAHAIGAVQVHESNPILHSAHRERAVGPIFKNGLPLSEAEQLGQIPGFYMRAANGMNYWIGSKADEAKLNIDDAGKRFLSPAFAYGYDIEYSFGQIVGGGSPWANVSSADLFV